MLEDHQKEEDYLEEYNRCYSRIVLVLINFKMILPYYRMIFIVF